jgi:flagellar biogenesis protein FliO
MPGTGAVGASYGDLLATSLVVLVGVCVAAFVVVRLVGRLSTAGRSRGPQLLDVIARLPLEPRRSLYVVQVAGKTLLVGTSEMGLSVLSELDGAAVDARVVARPSFGDLVRGAWSGRRGTTARTEREVIARDAPLAGEDAMLASQDAGAGPPPGAPEASGRDGAGSMARGAEPVPRDDAGTREAP